MLKCQNHNCVTGHVFLQILSEHTHVRRMAIKQLNSIRYQDMHSVQLISKIRPIFNFRTRNHHQYFFHEQKKEHKYMLFSSYSFIYTNMIN